MNNRIHHEQITSGGLAPLLAMSLMAGAWTSHVSAQYTYEIIADTADGFSAILSASMNDSGDIAFAAIEGGVTKVYFTNDPWNAGTGDSIDNAAGPVLNDDGWIVYLELDPVDGRVVGISRSTDLTMPGEMIVEADPDDEIIGGPAINDGDPPDNIAYWSMSMVRPFMQNVILLDSNGDVVFGAGDSVEFPSQQLSAPAISDNALLSYVRLEIDGTRTLVMGADTFPISAGGFVSPPTIDVVGVVDTVAVFLRDPDNPLDPRTAGIYTAAGGVLTEFELLDGIADIWIPATNTRPFINQDGDIAYTAVQPAPDPDDPPENQAILAVRGDLSLKEIVVEAGDMLDSTGVVIDHSLELFGRNTCDMIFIAALDDDADGKADRQVLVRATTTIPAPEGFDAFRGFFDSGDLNSLLESDDDKLCYNPGIVLGQTEAPVTLDFIATLPNDSPALLDVTIESSANTVGLELTFSFWNYNTNSWDVVGTAAQSLNADTVRTFSGTPADHVEPGTGEVRTRYEVREVGVVFVFPWLDCVDQVFWNTCN